MKLWNSFNAFFINFKYFILNFTNFLLCKFFLDIHKHDQSLEHICPCLGSERNCKADCRSKSRRHVDDCKPWLNREVSTTHHHWYMVISEQCCYGTLSLLRSAEDVNTGIMTSYLRHCLRSLIIKTLTPVVRRWSGDGQKMVRRWSGDGQEMVSHGHENEWVKQDQHQESTQPEQSTDVIWSLRIKSHGTCLVEFKWGYGKMIIHMYFII